MESLDEIVAEFLVESHENLDRLDRDLLALEHDPGSSDLLAGVFRTIHTIKGTSAFLALPRLERLTHAGENLLSRLRDGTITLTDARATALLQLVDAVRGLLAAVESTGTEGDDDHGGLVATLAALLADDAPAGGDVVAPVDGTDADGADADGTDADGTDADGTDADGTDADGTQAGTPGPGRRAAADATVRVDVERLDVLVRLVGELVLARNQLAAHLDDELAAGSPLARSAERLGVVTGELQEQVLRTRMQPVDAVWRTMPRVVRDLARTCGRQVRLEMHGGDTELDRSVLEAIKDPLTHLVRNAVDHGIEPPGERVSAGKPVEGTLTLRAYHKAGQVHLEVGDDGAGIDPRHIGARALERGLVSEARLSAMSAREVRDLVFVPGFSTAARVTSVSGRGVGMDVVRTRVEAVGGSVDVASAVGRGSTFRLTVPLTLAIVPALTVGCAGHRYALPQVAVLELVRLPGGHGVELVHGTPVHRLRGELLPLARLDEQLGLRPTDAPRHAAAGVVVVLRAGQRRFGLLVDDVLDTQEVVVEPLGRRLGAIPVYAGATIQGDGSVALVLDAAALARRCGVLAGPLDGPLEQHVTGAGAAVAA